MEIFYWEKTFHAGKKIRKNDFAPSEKFSCYAPDAVHKIPHKFAESTENFGIGLI